jgi:hypothetical protein
MNTIKMTASRAEAYTNMNRVMTRSLALLAREMDGERRDRQRANLQMEGRLNNCEMELAKSREDIQTLQNVIADMSRLADTKKKISKCTHCREEGHNRVTCPQKRAAFLDFVYR